METTTSKKNIGSIIRIDKPKNSIKGTHGWQVRLPIGIPHKYHSKLFSDKMYGSSGKALVAAEQYLNEQLRLHPDRYRVSPPHGRPFFEKPPSNNTSGRVGVFRSHSFHGQTGKKQEFWAAFCPVGPSGGFYAKRFYIVTHGEEGAKKMASEFRAMWEEAALQGEEAVARFFEAYEEGWL